MAKKDFRILVAVSNPSFSRKVVNELRKTYTVHMAKNIRDFSHKIHKKDFDLIIIDYRFSGMRAEDVYQGIMLLHPNALFVVYTAKDKKELAMRLWKRRALDYITATKDVFHFAEEVHKCVRWIVEKTDMTQLSKKIDEMAESIKNISRRIERGR
jgi:DNA-binding NtrC family response regulator